MAQKQAFLSAIDAVMANHGIDLGKTAKPDAANDCEDAGEYTEIGEHLKQEERFRSALLKCRDVADDDILAGVLSDHLEAAEIAVAALKSTSLKL